SDCEREQADGNQGRTRHVTPPPSACPRRLVPSPAPLSIPTSCHLSSSPTILLRPTGTVPPHSRRAVPDHAGRSASEHVATAGGDEVGRHRPELTAQAVPV